MNVPITSARRVVIVGGGFTGCCAAVQLVRTAKVPLAITVIEANERLGRGLAYSATDADHRLNAPTYVHSMLPDDAWHFTRWVLDNKVLERDPQALWTDGGMYIRRRDFGTYIEDTVHQHRHWPATGSSITHLCDRAEDMHIEGNRGWVRTGGGQLLEADMVIVATGNPVPRLQTPFDPALASHPNVIENPLDTARLQGIPPQARVLLVGSGLTALDVLSTLVRQGHQGGIVVTSRRGQRPKPQGPMPAALAQASSPAALAMLPGGIVLARIMGPAPAYLTEGSQPLSLRAMVKALRQKIRETQAAGATWYQAFDDLRDAVWQLWPQLPVPEQRRFLTKMRTWYDVHRFRSPPQNEDMVRAAEARGLIRFCAARLQSVSSAASDQTLNVVMREQGQTQHTQESFDVVINCTGLDAAKGASANPFLLAAVNAGLIRRDGCGLGFEVDADCRAVDAKGTAHSVLRVVGPPTAGSFGDPIGAMFIGAQIHRMLPDVLRTLDAAAESGGLDYGYADDINPETAWEWMKSGEAVMVDVRSEAERNWVGHVPSSVALPWMHWPGGALNPDFNDGLSELAAQGKKLLMLCRTGVRSIAAARRATELGLQAYNILEGFEGALDAKEQRGHINGWRHRQLPWKQG